MNPKDKCVDFGNLQIDETVTKTVQVVNKSRTPAVVMFALAENFPEVEQTEIIENMSSKTSLKSVESSLIDIIQIYPTNYIKISPQKVIKVFVKLYPVCRFSPFTKKVTFNCHFKKEISINLFYISPLIMRKIILK